MYVFIKAVDIIVYYFFLKIKITGIPAESQTVLEADHVQPFVGADLSKTVSICNQQQTLAGKEFKIIQIF